MLLFTLADIFNKVSQGRWLGHLHFYPHDQPFCADWLNQFSRDLAAKADFEFGDRIIVTDEACSETVATMLWLWSKGAVVVPVRHTMTQDAIDTIADNCNARLIIRCGEVSTCTTYQIHSSTFEHHSQRRVCGTDLALMIYTSGSTGKPKGIMLSHANVLSAMYAIGDYLELHWQEHILGLSPLSFDYGLYQALFCFTFDCQLTLFAENFHPIKVLKVIETQHITLLPVVPTMASALAKVMQAFKKHLPNLVKLTNTGGHLGEQTIETLETLQPQLQVYAMYGLTECKRALYLPPKDSKTKRGSVGIPMAGLEAKVFNEQQGRYIEAKCGEIGELFVRGASVMQGYYGNSDAGACLVNDSYRDDNWLATGDLFSQDEEGYFYFRGRSKDLIKQAGFCLYPAELEAQIEKHPLVHLAAVVPHQDKFGDEIACLHIQLLEHDEDNQKALEQWLTDNIDSNYRPREVRFIEKMALTSNSKVDKQQLIACL